MTDLQRLENAVTELLSTHECVVIPNLGAFLLRSFPASANPFSGEIKPSGQTLFFNPSITNDDGLLLTHWRHQTGLDYTSAQLAIKDLVAFIINSVKTARSCSFGQLGNFFLHNDNKLLFLPSSALNLSKAAFGLGNIVLDEIVKNQTIHHVKTVEKTETSAENVTLKVDAEIQEAEIIELNFSQQKSKGLIWKIAASVCLISLSAATIYYGKYFSQTRQNVQTASHMPASQPTTPAEEKTTINKTTSNKNSENFVSLLTETDMNMGMAAIKDGEGNVFICGGAYLSRALAENECRGWKKAGIPAVIGNKKGSSLVKVVIGRFENEQSASTYLEKLPINTGFHAGLLTAKLQFD
jgi:nucleoid DNA-binding protein